jgi:hypothetical protein
VTRWTNALLQKEKPGHMVDVLIAAQHNPLVARRFVSAFDGLLVPGQVRPEPA